MSAPLARLLISDVDGTLVTNDKVLTPGAVAAARALRAAGVGLALTSSRPPRGLAMLAGPLELDLPLGGFNGGALVTPEFKVLRTLLLGRDVVVAAGEALAELGLDIWLYTGEDWYVPGPEAPHVARETFILQFAPKILPDWSRGPLEETVKLVGVSDDPALMLKAEGVASRVLGPRASATRSAAHFLDVTHPEANKGAIVLEFSRRLDIPTSEIATIGDMPNDVLMFEKSGLSFAMGNASDAVKARATRVTASNEEEGFAKAVAVLLAGRS